jgi:uncharacterized protein
LTAKRLPAIAIAAIAASLAAAPVAQLADAAVLHRTVELAAGAGLAGLAAYGALCGLVARRFTRGRRMTVAAAADGCGAQTVRFAARDVAATIEAWHLRAAAGGAARGAVVFVHGKDACRSELLKAPTLDLATCFAGAGFDVLMIDLRGHGRSDPAPLTYGHHERHDVLGAVDWLRAHGHVRIGVFGASMGAAATLLAAAEEPAVAAIVADSAFADFGQMIERQFARLARLPRQVLPGALAIGRAITGVALQRVRPIDGARALVGRPVLVIHSAGDRFVPACDAEAIAAAAGAELWITPTEGHIGSYRAAPEPYVQRVLGFFERHLGAAAGQARQR